MSVSLIEAEERAFGKVENVEVSDKRWQEVLEDSQRIKEALNRLPPDEVVVGGNELDWTPDI